MSISASSECLRCVPAGYTRCQGTVKKTLNQVQSVYHQSCTAVHLSLGAFSADPSPAGIAGRFLDRLPGAEVCEELRL
jgi:hypothetical protein